MKCVNISKVISIILLNLLFPLLLFAAEQPQLKVEPLVLDFGWTLDDLQLKITNEGGGTLTWSADENPSEEWIVINHNNGTILSVKINDRTRRWLSIINSSNGSLGPGESDYLQVVVEREGLYEGTNYGEIIVTSNGGDQAIDIIVEVGDTPTQPILHVNPDVLDFNVGLSTLKFNIKNRGVGTLNWSAAEDPDQSWITSISPSSGNLESMDEQEVTVTVNRSSLSDGIYSGLISINSNAGNSQVEVEIIVGDRPSQIRANVGGFSHTDINSHYFSTDRPYQEGAWGAIRGHKYSVSNDISNTVDDVLYQTELFWLDGYRFDVENGSYTVILHFAELYYNYVGGRVFDTYLENDLVLDHFDIYSQAGFQTATTRTFNNVYVSDGRLDIDFAHHQAHAKLSAIEIIAENTNEPIVSIDPNKLDFGSSKNSLSFKITNIGTGTLDWTTAENPEKSWITSISPDHGNNTAGESTIVTVTVDRTGLDPGYYNGQILISSNGGEETLNIILAVGDEINLYKINGGGQQDYTDLAGNVWKKDQAYQSDGWGFVGGQVYSTNSSIENTEDDLLYQSERYEMSAYRFNVENKSYKIMLHFAEIYHNAPNQRKFDVSLEGTKVLDNYDIFADVGANYATVKTFTTEVNDGLLDIEFYPETDAAKISAIEIFTVSGTPAISVEPTTLDFGTSATLMTFEVTNTGGGTLEWTAAENPDESWITSVTPTGGNLATGEIDIVTVTVDRAELEAGEYSGTISVTSNGGNQEIAVTMTVLSQDPVLSVAPTTLDFGISETQLTFEVTNTGEGTLEWTAAENPDESWMTSVTPTGGNLATGEIDIATVTVDRSELEAGEYSGTISVTSNGGNQEIAVTMTVLSQDPVLSVAPTTLDFGTSETQLTFEVTNTGEGTLEWTAAENPDESWMTSVTPTGGNLATGEIDIVTVIVDRAELEDGNYTGTINVTSNGGNQDVAVKMTVSSTPSPVYVQRVNCGSSVSYTDKNDQVWAVDQQYSAGTWGYIEGRIYSTSDPIDNTGDDVLYQCERWNQTLEYRFDLTNRDYKVILHFAEIYYKRSNVRIFDVKLEGAMVLENYDIYADVGHDVAVSKNYQVSVNDGQLNIVLIADKNAAKISAIEVISLSDDPLLSVIPTHLDFGTTQTSLSFKITNSGGGILEWNATENPDELWITGIIPESGSLISGDSNMVVVTVDRTGMPAGEYSGTISVSSNGGNQDVTVSMIVPNQDPVLSVTPTTLNFGTSETQLTFEVTNTGAGTLEWNASENPDETWITTVTPSSGSLEAGKIDTIIVTVDRDDLEAGEYSGIISVTSNGGNQDITVSMTVLSQDPLLSVTPTTLEFGTSETQLTFEVTNTGAGTLEWNASENPDETWITSVAPSSGALQAGEIDTVTVIVDRSELQAGEYSGTISVTSNGSNQDVTVSMTVPNQDPVLSVTPTTLNFGTSETQLTFEVTNTGAGTLEWNASENPDETWITTVTPSSGSLEAGKIDTITVTVDRSDLEAGEYSGIISVTSNGGNQDITVSMTVLSQDPVLSVTPTTLNFGTSETQLTFEVTNTGAGTLEWNASENPDETWITSVVPLDGNLAAGEVDTVTVTVDRSELEDGDYAGTINVTSNGGDQVVTVEMLVSSAPPAYVQRVNCGSSTIYTDKNDQIWAVDQQYSAGNWGYIEGRTYSTSDPIDNTEDDVLYQSERWNPILEYRFDVINRDYRVVLHFAETYYKRSNVRVFDVKLEGTTVLEDFDIYAEVGHDVAVSKTYEVAVNDGQLNIVLTADRNAAKISAIEVLSISDDPLLSVSPTNLDFGTTQTSLSFTITNFGKGILEWNATENPDVSWITSVNPSNGNLAADESAAVSVIIERTGLAIGNYLGTISVSSNGGNQNVTVNMIVPDTTQTPAYRVNCGSSNSYTDLAGQVWEPDQSYSGSSWGYNGGGTFATTDPIDNTEDDKLYQSERWGLDGYYFDLENGEYEVTLLFAEIYFTDVNKRVFQVEIEGQRVLTDFDIFAEAGHDNAIDKIFDVTVDDNQLNIDFIKGIEDPKISAIQIIKIPQGVGSEQFVTGIEASKMSQTPAAFTLHQNHPNPFNSMTSISFDLPFEASVTLNIYNLMGQKLNSLVNGMLSPGSHSFIWTGKDESGITLPSGLYFYRIEAIENSGNSNKVFSMTRKLSLIK